METHCAALLLSQELLKLMTQVEITICNKRGLHARAAAKFVATASEYESTIKVGRDTASLVDGKSIMSVMMLAASKGTSLQVLAEGPDESKAVEAICELISDKFGEGE